MYRIISSLEGAETDKAGSGHAEYDWLVDGGGRGNESMPAKHSGAEAQLSIKYSVLFLKCGHFL